MGPKTLLTCILRQHWLWLMCYQYVSASCFQLKQLKNAF